MIRRCSVLLLVAALLAPAAASAQARYYRQSDSGLVLAGRLGYGFPNGDVATGEPDVPPRMSDTWSGKIPIWLELGYRFNGLVRAGLYLELAPTMVSDSACPADVSCSAADVRVGLDVQFHFMPHQQIDPWLGLGFGAEFLTYHQSLPGPDYDERWSGWELPMIEGGLDMPLAPRFSLGPYMALSFSQFNRRRVTQDNVTTEFTPSGESTHSWFQVGIKGTFAL
jgi:hypothetical protein